MDAKGDEKRARILAAAKEEFLKKGYAEANLREIGAAAGSSLGGIYRFFNGKEVLFKALVDPALSLFETHFNETLCADIPSFPKKLQTCVASFLADLHEHMDSMQMLAKAGDPQCEAVLMQKSQSFGSEIAKKTPVSEVAATMLFSTTFQALINASLHKLSKENYDAYAQTLSRFLAAGWLGCLEK